MKPIKESIEAVQKKLDSFPDFIYLPPKAKYVGLNNDGEVELEECDYNDEDVRK